MWLLRRQEESTKVLEGGDRDEGDPICSDRHICPRLRLLIRQAAPLPFLPPVAKGRREVPVIEGLARHKHVALGTTGVRSVTLLQDHNCVLCIVVHKLNPEVGTI